MPDSIIRIQVSQRSDGADIAEYNGYQAISRHCAESKLARILVEANYPDGPWETVRNGKVCLFGRSLIGLAKLTIAEGAKQVSFTRWQPMLSRPARAA
jgi:hypothetical protein